MSVTVRIFDAGLKPDEDAVSVTGRFPSAVPFAIACSGTLTDGWFAGIVTDAGAVIFPVSEDASATSTGKAVTGDRVTVADAAGFAPSMSSVRSTSSAIDGPSSS